MELIVSRKIKKDFAESGKYDPVFSELSNKINEETITDIIKKSEEIREEGKRNPISKGGYPSETPAINIMESTFNLFEDEFKKRIVSAFDVLRTCLDVKTDSQINKIQKAEEREAYELKRELTNLEKKKELWDRMLSGGAITSEQYINKLSEIEELKNKIRIIKEEKQ